MKITIEQPTLSAAVAKSQSVVERRNTIPILANVLIDATDSGLQFRATDLDIEVTNTATATIEEQGSVTVPASMLGDIVKKLPKSKIVSLYTDGHYLHIECGQSKFSLPTMVVEDFPVMTSINYDNTFVIHSDALRRLFDKSRFAISTEETRYYLNGVYMHVADDGLRCVATDGHRLALVDATLPNGADGMNGVIVPRKTVGELIKMLDGDFDVTVSVSETKVRFSTDGVVLTSKVIDGTFPDYTRVIPKDNKKTMTVDADDFSKAVDRVSTVSSDRSRAIKVSVSGDCVVLSVKSPEVGAGEEGMAATYDGDAMDIGFNAKYLLDVMAQIDSADAVFSLGDQGAAAMLTDNGAVYVLMPMRI